MGIKPKKPTYWLILLMVIATIFLPIMRSKAFAVHGIASWQQQINILNGEFTTTNTTYSPTDNSLGLIRFDPSEYDGETVYFEALVKCDACSGGNNQASVALYTSSGSSASTLSTSSGSYVLLRSGSLSLTADDFTVRFKLDAGSGTAYLKTARLVIDQEETGNSGIANTQTHVEVGHSENTTSTGATELTSPKYYVYDNSKFSGTKNAYFEATLKTTNSSTTATYYFDSYDTGGEEWLTNPGNMSDVSAASYASSNLDGDVEKLTSNTSGGDDLGTITKVEIRARAYQDNDLSGSITLRPIFNGSDGNDHGFAPPVAVGDWSEYIDVTTDTNAPSTWTWADIATIDADVVWNQNVGSNTGFVSKVEIRVTYEDENILAYAELYNRTNNAVVATVSTASENYQRVRSAALSSNWDTTNADQYGVRIYTANSSNAAYISNAKIIIDQAETGGVTKLELAHQYMTTSRIQTYASYVQDTFINEYQPESFTTPHVRKAYLDITMKTSGGVGYVALYNVSDTDTVDSGVNSEVTTTSTSFEQKLSGNLGNNADWPQTTKTLDSIMKATNTYSVTVSSSRLLIEIANLDPSLTFSINGVSAGQAHNGVTASITSTATDVSFGSITPGTPAYGTQEISIDTNESNQSYIVSVKLSAQLQGLYPGNNFDAFSGSGATWDSPQNWLEPTGSIKNTNTGWFGANTTDTSVSGWASATSKFGPISTSDVIVMQSSNGSDKTEYVSYAIEANAAQPADRYSGTLIYSVTPAF